MGEKHSSMFENGGFSMSNQSSQQAIGEHMVAIWQRLGNNRLLLLGLVGVVALLALQLLWPGKEAAAPLLPSTLVDTNRTQTQENTLEQISAYRLQLEQQLAELLAEIKGVGKVRVMLSLESGPEAVPAVSMQTSQRTTEEKDSSGGTRLTAEESQSSNLVTSNNQLLLLQEKLPPIKGVVIVAQGAHNSTIRLELLRAVQTICNVPAYSVEVLPGK